MHTHRYKIYGTEIEHVFNEKDLGITIDSELKFEEHISLKARKANAIMGMTTAGIRSSSFTFLDCNLFKKLYSPQFYFPRL